MTRTVTVPASETGRTRRTGLVMSALVAMARPSHLALILGVAATGGLAAMAHGASPRLESVASGGVALVLIAASVHLANEWADHETDRLTARTPFSGGSGALARSGLPRRLALWAGVVALLMGTTTAALGVLSGWLPAAAAVLLVLGAALGWAYSVPPIALAWRGLGELDNAAAGGLVLPLFGYAALAGAIPPSIVLAFVPFAALDFSNLLATTWPDRRADAAVGKRTLATRWSPRQLRRAHLTADVTVVGLLVALTVAGSVPLPVGVAGLLTVPLVAWGFVRYTRQESPAPTVAAMLALALASLLGWLVPALEAAR